MDTKLTIAVIFGGQSSEHEVSCMSAANVAKALSQDRYQLVYIGITKNGNWLYADDINQLLDGSWKRSRIQAVVSPDAEDHGVLLIEEGTPVRKIWIDAAFPVLHGLYGEDGTIQGLFELARIPYVGCGVLASSVSMDKLYTKRIAGTLGIPQADYVAFPYLKGSEIEAAVDQVESALLYPVFVKPSRTGSSQGIHRAADQCQLIAALEDARQYDTRVLVEQAINGRELECAVLGGREPKASGIGEILAADEFYTYDAKYHNQESKTRIHPDLPDGAEGMIRADAVKIFEAVDGYGLARVDFFLENGSGRVIFNEINTMPGFTAISMYPMLWEAAGWEKTALLDELIRLAMER